MQKCYGLVVCGGKSSRMGMDKSLIDYHGKPQWKHVFEMLEGICDKVFVSCNNSQAENADFKENALIDLHSYENIGPMASLLTAFEGYPDKDFVVVGCDYPFLTQKELNDFLIFTNGKKTASAFYKTAYTVYEPLLAWYSHHSKNELLRMFGNEEYSLQYFLKAVEAQKYIPLNSQSMKSVDTLEESQNARRIIHGQNQF